MKKGDVIGIAKVTEKGEPLIRGCDSESNVRVWMSKNCIDVYKKAIAYNIVGDIDNLGKFMAVSAGAYTQDVEAKVMWVVEKEASIVLPDGSMKLINIDEDGWKVIREAAPSFQSEVANMSEGELRAAIDGMRTSRLTVTPKKTKAKAKAPAEKKVVDPMEAMMNKIPKDKREALMKRLGMM